MKFALLQEGQKTVMVYFQRHEIAVEYDVNRWAGEAFRDQARNARLQDDDPKRLEVNKKLIGRLVTAWDLTEDECPESCQERKDATGDPICREHAMPITPETIAGLPPLLRTNIVNAIFEDVNAGGTDPKRNGSS